MAGSRSASGTRSASRNTATSPRIRSNPDIVYGGKVSRYNRRTGEVVQVAPRVGRGGGDYRVVRTQPVLFSPIDPHMLYFASNTLWKTTTGGNGWTQISPGSDAEDLGRPGERRQVSRHAAPHSRHSAASSIRSRRHRWT